MKRGNESSPLQAILHAYDIRGRVPEQLNEYWAARLGAAFAAFVREENPSAERVLVGRDMRQSGSALAEAFARSVLSAGLDVTDLGLVSTDMFYYASGSLDAPGVVFTASHNPPAYNGLKACLAGAVPLSAAEGLGRVCELALQGSPETAVEANPASSRATASVLGRCGEVGIVEEFAAHVRSFVNPRHLAGLRVVADVANGMGALVLPAVFRPIELELEILFGELDGNFPNHPADPLVEANLEPLRLRVQETQADVGIAFDGDGDRVFFVDDEGRVLSGSVAGALLAAKYLRAEPGASVLYNAVCSRVVPEAIAEHGGVGIPTPVGHSLIKGHMIATGAAFACEHSGHFYFRDNYRSDSGVLAALSMLELLGESRQALSRLRRPFDRYAASGEINFSVSDPAATVELLAGAFTDSKQSRLDGLSVDCGCWWFNVRVSNTETLLRLNLESSSESECVKRTRELRELIGSLSEPAPAGTATGGSGSDG